MQVILEKSKLTPKHEGCPGAYFYRSANVSIFKSQVVCSISCISGSTINLILARFGWPLNMWIAVCIARYIGDTKTYFTLSAWTLLAFASAWATPIGSWSSGSTPLGSVIRAANSADSFPC